MERPAILDRIAYLNWDLEFEPIEHDGVIWWAFEAPDALTGRARYFNARQWIVPEHATDDQIVGAAWMALKAAIEHEAAEVFLVDGYRPFDPHTPRLRS